MENNRMKNDHIIQYPEAYSHCIGCSSCELCCALVHDGVTGPTHGGIKLGLGKLDKLVHKVYVCEHCADHPCYEACPKKDSAMCVDENGIVYINEEFCIGCGLCAKKCKLKPSRITMDKKDRKARKCDLCRDREGGPQCIKECPVVCIGLASAPLPYDPEKIGGED